MATQDKHLIGNGLFEKITQHQLNEQRVELYEECVTHFQFETIIIIIIKSFILINQ
ncbi:MAG: hypothetical protein ACI8RD_003161 [Bacillariaceae sp.]|jgi:hypothetical protein